MTENEACELLGVQPGVSPEALKRAYRRLVKDTHPDMGGSATLFRQAQAAYDFLRNRSTDTAPDTAPDTPPGYAPYASPFGYSPFAYTPENTWPHTAGDAELHRREEERLRREAAGKQAEQKQRAREQEKARCEAEEQQRVIRNELSETAIEIAALQKDIRTLHKEYTHYYEELRKFSVFPHISKKIKAMALASQLEKKSALLKSAADRYDQLEKKMTRS